MVAHSTGTAIAVHAGPGVAQDPCRVPAQPTAHHARTALVRLRLHLTDETGYPPGDAWLSSQRTALTTEGAVSSPSNGHQPAEKRVTGAKEMVGCRWDGAAAAPPMGFPQATLRRVRGATGCGGRPGAGARPGRLSVTEEGCRCQRDRVPRPRLDGSSREAVETSFAGILGSRSGSSCSHAYPTGRASRDPQRRPAA